MKIKIIEEGYGAFTGFFGTVEFIDGVSVDVTKQEARLMSAVIRVVDADTGKEIGALADFANNQETTVNVATLPTLEELEKSGQVQPKAEEAVKKETPAFSKEDLEAIADKGGISALRKVADQFDVRGTSINKLITGILLAQGLAIEVPSEEE